MNGGSAVFLGLGVRFQDVRDCQQLVELAASRGRPAFHVESVANLDVDRLKAFSVIGLTAGTSTVAETIDAVERALEATERDSSCHAIEPSTTAL